MWRAVSVRAGYFGLAAALFLAGFLAGQSTSRHHAEAQERFRNQGVRQQWQTQFGFAIPANGAAFVRGEDARAYLVKADGTVEQLSVGDGPRTSTPLRPQ